MASGTTTVNFGASPGSPEAEVDVSGQAGFVSTSEVEAWVQPVATADHSVDEHIIESIDVVAFYKVDGTFTIRAWETSPPAQKQANYKHGSGHRSTQMTAAGQASTGGGGTTGLPAVNRLYGQFTVGWAWN